MMKHYEKLLAKGSFSREQLIEIVGTATAANQVIYEYQKKGLIEKVKPSRENRMEKLLPSASGLRMNRRDLKLRLTVLKLLLV